jgi:hypothetical protein
MSTTQFIQSLLKWLASPGQYASQLGTAIRSAGDLWSSTETQSKLDEKISGVRAGENVTIDVSDPYNPKINAIGTGFGDMNKSVYDPTGVEADAFDRANHHGDIDAGDIDGLATVATSGSYNDLSDKPASGGDVTGPAGATAGNFPVLDATGKVLSDSGSKPADFASAAQGGKADTAVQPARTVGTGTGLTGGGDLSADRTIALNSGSIASLAKADSALQASDIGSSVQPYDVDTAKTDVAQAWTETQRGTIVPVAPAATMTLNLNDGQEFRLSAGLNQNATVQLSNADSHIGAKFSFTGYNNGTGGYTLSYGSGMVSIGGASPTAIPTAASAKWRVDGQIVAAGEYHFTTRGVGA